VGVHASVQHLIAQLGHDEARLEGEPGSQAQELGDEPKDHRKRSSHTPAQATKRSDNFFCATQSSTTPSLEMMLETR
jgi:hypothetical protein